MSTVSDPCCLSFSDSWEQGLTISTFPALQRVSGAELEQLIYFISVREQIVSHRIMISQNGNLYFTFHRNFDVFN